MRIKPTFKDYEFEIENPDFEVGDYWYRPGHPFRDEVDFTRCRAEIPSNKRKLSYMQCPHKKEYGKYCRKHRKFEEWKGSIWDD